MRGTPAERFWAKVDLTGDCWIWTAGKTKYGYGQFYITGSDTDRIRRYAHVWSYETHVGPVPDGLEVDHLCRNTSCVRPEHLEAVTHAVNKARTIGIKKGPYNVGSHCKHGHERSPENTGVNADGYRFCRLCNRAAVARSRRQKHIHL